MSIKDWQVGQTVVIHCPEGKYVATKVEAIGRKLVTTKMEGYSDNFQFDATFEPPMYRAQSTGTPYYMHTPEQSEEVIYIERTIRGLGKAIEHYSSHNGNRLPIPMEVLLLIGDHLNIPKPKHLQDKERHGVNKTPIPPSSRSAVRSPNGRIS